MSHSKLYRLKNDVIDALREFADPEYQKRVWVNAQGPEESSYREAYYSFIDSMPEDLVASAEELSWTDEYTRNFKKFWDLLKQFAGRYPISKVADAVVVEAPEWPEIVALARELLITH